MKRLNNIYEETYKFENLEEAHKNAKKDKGFYSEVQMVDSKRNYYLLQIHNMLQNHTYEISEKDYTNKIIHDRTKDRKLWKLKYYPHRIIQWAIMLQIGPTIDSVFTNFTCASLPRRGIHRAYILLKRYLKNEEDTKYCLKIDIRHFYENVDKEILKKLLRKKFKDKELLWLLDLIIDSCPQGLPMGSYLSQYLANFYLAYFDH